MTRETRDEYFVRMAELVASRGTCRRRKVGCVLVSERGHVLATGYNGVAAGEHHCLDVACAGAERPSGEGLDMCEAIHAEQNALLQCRDVWAIDTAYVTDSPCATCQKLLMNTGCRRIVAARGYTHGVTHWKREIVVIGQ